MFKFIDYTHVSLGLFPVINLNGEGADSTLGSVDGVSIITERLTDPNAAGMTEWIFEAVYIEREVRPEYDRVESYVHIRENVLVFNYDEFISALTRFVNGVNQTTLANRCGFYALKLNNLTREDIRASLFMNYRITQ